MASHFGQNIFLISSDVPSQRLHSLCCFHISLFRIQLFLCSHFSYWIYGDGIKRVFFFFLRIHCKMWCLNKKYLNIDRVSILILVTFESIQFHLNDIMAIAWMVSSEVIHSVVNVWGNFNFMQINIRLLYFNANRLGLVFFLCRDSEPKPTCIFLLLLLLWW